MKKLFILVLILTICSIKSYAIGTQPELKSNGKWTTIGVSNVTAFAVNASSAAYTTLAVRNQDSTDTIWCSETQSVAQAEQGAQIKPGEMMVFVLREGETYYCKNDGAATVNASLFRGR